MKREEGRERERKVREKIRGIGMIIIGITALTILGWVFISVFIQRNEDLGLVNSQKILNSLEEGKRLPWSSDENDKVVAVLDCDGTKYFLGMNQVLDSRFEKCKYHLAEDINILVSYNIFNKNGKLEFSSSE